MISVKIREFFVKSCLKPQVSVNEGAYLNLKNMCFSGYIRTVFSFTECKVDTDVVKALQKTCLV